MYVYVSGVYPTLPRRSTCDLNREWAVNSGVHKRRRVHLAVFGFVRSGVRLTVRQRAADDARQLHARSHHVRHNRTAVSGNVISRELPPDALAFHAGRRAIGTLEQIPGERGLELRHVKNDHDLRLVVYRAPIARIWPVVAADGFGAPFETVFLTTVVGNGLIDVHRFSVSDESVVVSIRHIHIQSVVKHR